MSVLEASNEVQIFNNEAFDSRGGGLESELEPSVDMKASWMDLDKKGLSASIESDSSKENRNPLIPESPSPALFKTPVQKTTLSGKIGSGKGIKDGTLRDEAMIGKEIEEIQMEMSRLSLKLESLKLEKVERKKVRIKERRCSIVPARYMETNSKQSTISKPVPIRKPQDSMPINRRGVSLCPAEIYSATKPDISSSNAKQSRRQSCFWKLGETDELKVTKARGGIGKSGSVSVSPKARPNPVPKFDTSRRAITTNGSKKLVPKNDAVMSSVQPKKLFKETERSLASATLKKPIKSGRVIPSRCNQNPTQTPDCVNATKIRSLSESESRVKKRWEIPAKGDVVVYTSCGDGEESRSTESTRSTVGVDEMGDVLRKIRTVRCVSESPRDSVAVKRVADLVGKKSFFADPGQALSFVDEEADGEENDAKN